MQTVRLTNVFKRTGDALLNAVNGTGPRLIVNQGGQGSSKTYSTLQVIYTYLKHSERKKATFCSYALPHLKKGVCTDFDNILTLFGENIGEIKSAPAQPVYRIGESEIDCYGIEGNLAMAHGPRRDLLYINECNRRISYEVFDQIFSRSQITLMDFNPDQEFWLHEKVLPNFPYVLIKSNFLDNPYLPENELNNILMKKDKPGFENWWKVYGLGELGRLEGAIFPNWRYGDFEKSLPFSFGMDFGYNDPDTLTKVAIDRKNKKIYVEECIYQSGLTPGELRDKVGRYANSRDLIVADCADARMIAELQRGFNIRKAIKSSGSVQEGIRLMQDFELVVTEDSVNVVKELNNYIWSDSRAGVPIQAFDHALDGIRYNVTYNLWDTIRRPVMTRKN